MRGWGIRIEPGKALLPLSVLCGTALLMTGAASTHAFSPGDVNGDGKVSVPDAVSALQFAVGSAEPSPDQRAAADVNGDGKINIQDVIRLLRAAVGIDTLPGPPADTGVDIYFNQKYEGGTRLRQQQVGVSWVIPKDWVGGVAEKDITFGMLSQAHSNSVGLVFALATAPNKPSLQTGAQLLSQPVDVGGGVVFQPDGPAQTSGNRIANTYATQTTLGKIVGQSVGELSDAGNALIFFVAGVEKERDYLKTVLDDLLASARYTAPQTYPWIQRLVGNKFRLDGGFYTPGENGGGSVSGDNNTFLDFCANMTFAYYYHGFVNSDAGIAEFEDRKSGQWGLAMDLLSTSAVLVPRDGSAVMTFKLGAYNQKDVTFNGNGSTRFPSDACTGG